MLAPVLPTGLAFLSGGWLEDALEVLRHLQGGSGNLAGIELSAILSATGRLKDQAKGSFWRWLRGAGPRAGDVILPRRIACHANAASWTMDKGKMSRPSIGIGQTIFPPDADAAKVKATCVGLFD